MRQVFADSHLRILLLHAVYSDGSAMFIKRDIRCGDSKKYYQTLFNLNRNYIRIILKSIYNLVDECKSKSASNTPRRNDWCYFCVELNEILYTFAQTVWVWKTLRSQEWLFCVYVYMEGSQLGHKWCGGFTTLTYIL